MERRDGRSTSRELNRLNACYRPKWIALTHTRAVLDSSSFNTNNSFRIGINIQVLNLDFDRIEDCSMKRSIWAICSMCPNPIWPANGVSPKQSNIRSKWMQTNACSVSLSLFLSPVHSFSHSLACRQCSQVSTKVRTWHRWFDKCV